MRYPVGRIYGQCSISVVSTFVIRSANWNVKTKIFAPIYFIRTMSGKILFPATNEEFFVHRKRLITFLSWKALRGPRNGRAAINYTLLGCDFTTLSDTLRRLVLNSRRQRKSAENGPVNSKFPSLKKLRSDWFSLKPFVRHSERGRKLLILFCKSVVENVIISGVGSKDLVS